MNNFLNGYKAITGIIITIVATFVLPHFTDINADEFLKNLDTLLQVLGLLLTAIGVGHKEQKIEDLKKKIKDK